MTAYLPLQTSIGKISSDLVSSERDQNKDQKVSTILFWLCMAVLSVCCAALYGS